MNLDDLDIENVISESKKLKQALDENGVADCPSCFEPVRKMYVDSRNWEINCPCGWGAAGADKISTH